MPAEVPAEHLEEATGVGQLPARLVASAPADAFGRPLARVESDEGTAVEDGLAHRERTLDSGLHEDTITGTGS